MGISRGQIVLVVFLGLMAYGIFSLIAAVGRVRVAASRTADL